MIQTTIETKIQTYNNNPQQYKNTYEINFNTANWETTTKLINSEKVVNNEY